MSEWGLVAFHYDYERLDRRGNPEQIKGFISKAYKYPGIIRMALHAKNGLEYFKERCDNGHFDFGLSLSPSPTNTWKELNLAFDVFFDHRCVDPGIDTVSVAIKHWKEHEEEYLSGDKLRDYLFNCEGFWGWLYISYTGSIKEGFKTQYGYYFREKLMDIQGAADTYYADRRKRYSDNEEFEDDYKGEMEEVYKTAEYFKNNAELFSTIENFEESCESILREQFEQLKADEEEYAKCIDSLDISVHTYNCLMRKRIRTIDELKEMSDDELSAIENLGKKGFEEIKNALKEHDKPKKDE